jgi:hypothetical protein
MYIASLLGIGQTDILGIATCSAASERGSSFVKHKTKNKLRNRDHLE